jgi:hypothetical protein
VRLKLLVQYLLQVIDGNFADNFTVLPRPMFSSILHPLMHIDQFVDDHDGRVHISLGACFHHPLYYIADFA